MKQLVNFAEEGPKHVCYVIVQQLVWGICSATQGYAPARARDTRYHHRPQTPCSCRGTVWRLALFQLQPRNECSRLTSISSIKHIIPIIVKMVLSKRMLAYWSLFALTIAIPTSQRPLQDDDDDDNDDTPLPLIIWHGKYSYNATTTKVL